MTQCLDGSLPRTCREQAVRIVCIWLTEEAVNGTTAVPICTEEMKVPLNVRLHARLFRGVSQHSALLRDAPGIIIFRDLFCERQPMHRALCKWLSAVVIDAAYNLDVVFSCVFFEFSLRKRVLDRFWWIWDGFGVLCFVLF